MQYNLSPKATTFFEIPLDSVRIMDSLNVQSLEVFLDTDPSERGYVHGGTTGYSVNIVKGDSVVIHTAMYNELTVDINVPGLLIAEKDKNGNIWRVGFQVATTSIRTGLTRKFDFPFRKMQAVSEKIEKYPISIYVNGQLRSSRFMVLPDKDANANQGIAVMPNSFISSEIYLQ
jgi:hypothetical protein